jgi:hypothetical protein
VEESALSVLLKLLDSAQTALFVFLTLLDLALAAH